MKHIVVDKNILFGSSAEKLKLFFTDKIFIITNSLTFELVKDDDNKRIVHFRKLLAIQNNLKIAPAIGTLLRYEGINGKACGKLSNHINPRDLSIISQLADENFVLSDKYISIIRKYESESLIYQKFLLGMISSMYDKYKTKEEADNKLKIMFDGKINSTSFINKIISKYKHELILSANLKKYPKNSATYRFFQIYYLYALDKRCRYQNLDAIFGSKKAMKDILHDVHDLNYLMLASLEGNFLTKEVNLIRYWKSIQDSDGLVLIN